MVHLRSKSINLKAFKKKKQLRNILQVKAKPCSEPAVEYLLESTNV